LAEFWDQGGVILKQSLRLKKFTLSFLGIPPNKSSFTDGSSAEMASTRTVQQGIHVG
jgi:hypothetical protein